MSILLMTATINSSYYGNISTKITNTEERKRQYKEALENYISYSRFDKIVFADNSKDALDENYFFELAEKNGKKLEFLELPGNIERMKTQGKSFGEAALIQDAFRNSKLIHEESAFYKVTGRIWIRNINKLISDVPENCFIAHNFKSWVLTSFFKIRCDDFYDLMGTAPDLCNDNTPDWLWCIEHVYYELLKNAINPVKSFQVYPDMRGVNSGSGGLYSKTTSQLLIRNLLLFLGLYRFNPNEQAYYPLLRRLE